jgi:oligopeptide transport system substrate-binding protein
VKQRVLALLLGLLPLACREAPKGLVVANGDDVSLLHPQRAASISDIRVLQALHAGLTRLDPVDLQPEPGLAARFWSAEGSKLWSFELRPDLRWSDGQAFGAEDVIRSWQQLADPGFASPYQSWLADAELEATGNVVTVRFPNPRPAFAEMCAFPALAPVPAHAAAEAVGAGPFRLVLRRVRDRVRVERNPHYWDVEHVQLEAIDFLTVESEVTALNLFLAGEVAYVSNAAELAIPELRKQLADSFAPTPQFASTFLRLNTSKPPFDQLETRRAFARAVDQHALGRALGQVRIATQHFVPVDTPGWKPAQLPSWLKQREPIQIEAPPGGFEYLYNSSELNRSVAEVLQDQWRRSLGQTVRLSNQEWKSFLSAQRGLEYQVSRSSWIGDYLDPISFLEIFHSSSGNSRTGWADAVYDELIEQARRESDPEARRIVLREAERRLLDQAVIVPLYHEVSMELVSPRLLGFHRNLRGYIDWGRLSWQAEEQR